MGGRNDVESSPSTQTPPPDSFPPTDDAATKIPRTRDEVADAEFAEFLKSIQDELPSQAPASILSKNRLQTTVPESTPTSTAINPANLHPTTMSCRSAFDLAFYCQSLGGQFNSIYRQGSLRNCSQLWGDFWFCIRTNRSWMDEKQRKERLMEHYRKRERKYVDGPSSEDVWKARRTMVVGAFEGDFDAVEKLLKQDNSTKRYGSNGNETGESGM